MSHKRRLEVIIDLYQRQEKQALEILGGSQRQVQAMMQKLASLEQYRQEYERRGLVQAGRQFSAHDLMEYQSFLNKLDQAINDQKRLIEQQEQQIEQNRTLWREKHQKTESLLKLDEKAQIQRLKQLEKNEQLEQDSRSTRSGNKSGTGTAW
jgi:flagellar FliJ protein